MNEEKGVGGRVLGVVESKSAEQSEAKKQRWPNHDHSLSNPTNHPLLDNTTNTLQTHSLLHPTPYTLHPLPASSLISFFLLILFFASACASHAPAVGEANQAEINVAAAANLSDAFTELGQQFTAGTGVRVTFSFGATAELAKQIENGAPFDVFAAADVEHVDGLNKKGLLVPETQAVYARGRLVLWTPQGSRVSLTNIDNLTRPEFERIAIAKPDVAPYGRAAVEALHALNLWLTVEPKVVYGQNVAQARQFAATGNAEAAFIPMSLVKAGDGQFIEIDEQLHAPINQALGVIKASNKQEAARRFAAYVSSPEGQALLERYGYRKPL